MGVCGSDYLVLSPRDFLVLLPDINIISPSTVALLAYKSRWLGLLDLCEQQCCSYETTAIL